MAAGKVRAAKQANSSLAGPLKEIVLKEHGLWIVVGILLISGCSSADYKARADKEVYDIIRRKQMQALGIDQAFTIDRDYTDPLIGLPRTQPEPLPNEQPRPAVVLSMAQTLEIAGKKNREYQSRKEDVYLTALALTMAEYEWGPIFSGGASTEYTKTSGDETLGGGLALGFSKLLSDGTRVGVDLTSDLLMHLVENPREAAWSLISAAITKPLWRGARKRIAQENLLQARYDVLYSIRSFARYRKSFAVSIAASYYRVLQERDSVDNAWNNYRNLIQARERTEMMARAGRLPEFQVDQARQNELRAKDRYIRSVQGYEQSLDQFKIQLGLPTDEAVFLDPDELVALRDGGIIHPSISADDAVAVALEARLDLATAYDRITDATRKVEVAENGLAPDIDLVLTSSVPTHRNRPNNFRTDFGTYTGGIDVDLPLNRRSERNTYRRALINRERSERDASLAADEVKLDVRDAWRKLQEARASYDIQQTSLILARRRVESTTLLLQAGRADTRDLLESRDALLEAQNALTGALIDHTIARLEFWRDIGVLEVNEKGLWKENYDLDKSGNTAEP